MKRNICETIAAVVCFTAAFFFDAWGFAATALGLFLVSEYSREL